MHDETIEKIRKSIINVTEASLENIANDTPLELDSMSRITLFSELENEFEIVIATENFEPEIFDTLESLEKFVKSNMEDS
jgi:acyl carrier protein